MNDNDRYVIRRAIAAEIRQARRDLRANHQINDQHTARLRMYYTGKIQALWALVHNHTEFQRY